MPQEIKHIPYPIPLQQGIVYGPITSRRLGKSLGINLLPTEYKLCNFDCLYCFYGPTDFRHDAKNFPPVDEILLTVENVLKSELAMNYITFSGNGAATLHPQFAKIVREVVALRDKYRAGTPVAILSNSTGLDGYEVLDAFKLFDLAIMKLDCGEEKIFRKLNRPRRGFKLQDLISIIKSMRGITLQTIFVDGEVANFSGKALEKWQEAVAEIAPESVQIYTLDRDLPEMGLKMVKKEILMHIAEDTNKNTGILVKSFGENL